MRVSDRVIEIVQDLECHHQGTDLSINGRTLTGVLRDIAKRARVEEDARSSLRAALNGVCGMLMLDDIADQIEREQGGRVSRMRVLAVVTEMERHVSGVEGAEDSPVARWARELRRALKSDTNDERDAQNPSCTGTAEPADVTSEAQKVTREDVDAIAWVREHGGLEEVEAHWSGRVPLKSVKWMIETHRAKRERLKAHALGLERKCAERGETIRELSDRAAKQSDEIRVMRDVIVETCARLGVEGTGSTVDDAQVIWREISRRLMPAGMEWPRYEDGEPVRPGDRLLDKGGDWFEAASFVFTCDWWSVRGYQTEGFGDLNDKTRRKLEGMAYGTCVRRPAPKVLDADGVEVEVGDDLYTVEGMLKFHVSAIDKKSGRIATEAMFALDKWADPKMYTHRAPVLAADGRPLRVGETVWLTDGSERHVVLSTEEDGIGSIVTEVQAPGAVKVHISPSRLTHERPDSLDRLAEDIGAMVAAWRSKRGLFDAQEAAAGCVGENTLGAALDSLVRRVKALAGDA